MTPTNEPAKHHQRTMTSSQSEDSQKSTSIENSIGSAHTATPKSLTVGFSSMTTITNSQPRLIEKSVIIHRDENGFGLRIKGQSPVFIEHVHENGAAWRAGVRALDLVAKVNGIPVGHMDHKDVVLTFKSCSRFVALTLISPEHQQLQREHQALQLQDHLDSNASSGASGHHSRQPSTYSQKVYQFFNRPPAVESAATIINQTATQRRLSSATNSSYSSIVSSMTLPQMMDRTASCRSTTSLIEAAHQNHNQLARTMQQQQQQQQQQQAKLSRHDSVEEGPDKRLAVCICCRSSIEGLLTGTQQTANICAQCQLKYKTTPGMASELAHRHLAQRQLHSSLRDGDVNAAGSLQLKNQSIVDLETTKQSNNNMISQSASAHSLPRTLQDTQAGKSSLTSKQRAAATTGVNRRAPSVQAPVKKPVVNKRIEIIREFIDTERTHTERLRCLNELFYRPLKHAGFMSSEQLRMVFSCHRTLYKIHRQIYRILMSANFDVYSEPLIGSALLEIFEGDLKRRLERASCSFCSAQATNIELLNKLTRRDTKAGEFLAQITSQRMVGRLGVKDLLASCFQRLAKYPLLLENLLKATPLEPKDDSADELELTTTAFESGGRGRLREARRPPNQPGGRQAAAHQRASKLHHQSISDEHEEGDDDDEENAEESEELESENEYGDEYEEEEDEDEETRLARLGAAEEARRNSRRIMAISLAEEREYIERALQQSRQILVRVNDSIRVAIARNRLKEIWKRTDKYPDVPLIDITKQQVVHEGLLTLRLSKRSFDVYVLLLNDYIIILTREGQDKYRLKFFTPEGKSSGPLALSSSSSSSGANSTSSTTISSNMVSGMGLFGSGSNTSSNNNNNNNNSISNSTTAANSNNNINLTITHPHQTVYSPVFVIDEHLTTRDAATDENGFYLLCKRKDDSRIYEFAARSPAERMKWRDKIQAAIERQMSRSNRRPSCASTITKSSSEISANDTAATNNKNSRVCANSDNTISNDLTSLSSHQLSPSSRKGHQQQGLTRARTPGSRPSTPSSEPTKIVGTISYVIDDGIVLPSNMESSRVLVDQAIQVNILDGSSTLRGQIVATRTTN